MEQSCNQTMLKTQAAMAAAYAAYAQKVADGGAADLSGDDNSIASILLALNEQERKAVCE